MRRREEADAYGSGGLELPCAIAGGKISPEGGNCPAGLLAVRVGQSNGGLSLDCTGTQIAQPPERSGRRNNGLTPLMGHAG